MTESLPGGCWGIRVMTATRLSQKLLSKTCNLSFPQRGTGVSKENTTNTFIACGTWLKTPFYTSSAGVELPLGTQRIPHPLSLLFKSGAYLCGQMCLHKLVSTLSSTFFWNVRKPSFVKKLKFFHGESPPSSLKAGFLVRSGQRRMGITPPPG